MAESRDSDNIHQSCSFPITQLCLPLCWLHLQTWPAQLSSVQFSKLLNRVHLCDPMDCSTPSFPVRHQLLELAQTHVHWVSDAIQPSHPLLSPSSPAFNLSQHQGLFQWFSSSHQVAKVLEFQLQHQSFQWMNIQDWFPLGWTGLISLQSKGHSKVLTTVWNTTSQFESISSSVFSLLYELSLLYVQPTLTSVHDYWKNHSFDFTDLYQQSNVSAF